MSERSQEQGLKDLTLLGNKETKYADNTPELANRNVI